MQLIAAHAADQRQAFGQLGAVLGEQRELPRQVAFARAVPQWIGALILTATAAGERHAVSEAAGKIVLAGEVNPVVVHAHHGAAIQAKQGVLQGEGLAVADLLLGVLDLVEVTALDLIARLPAVGLGIAPVALGLDVVELVTGGQGVVDAPVADQSGDLIVVANLGVIDVVIALAQALAVLAGDQRWAPVALRVLLALIMRSEERRVG